MTRDPKTTRCGIVTAITLMLRAIAKENAHGRAERKFGPLNRGQKHKTNTTKGTKMTI